MQPTTVSRRIQSVALTAGAIYICAWGIYYIAQETIRKTTLRRRKRRYPLLAPLLPPHALAAGARVAQRVGVLSRATPSSSSSHPSSSSSSSLRTSRSHSPSRSSPPSPSSPSHAPSTPTSSKGKARAHDLHDHDLDHVQHRLQPHLVDTNPQTRPNGWYGNASQHEIEKIQNRFASLKILGRWANVVPEWREQGAWEWVLWKGFYSLFYKPRIWWDGGLKRDLASPEGRKRVDELLPVHQIDHARLWGRVLPVPAASANASTVVVDKGRERHVAPASLATPASSPSPSSAPAAVEEGITFTWIGQSTCLFQIHGLTVLTDPVFGEQPLESIFSPTRMRPMPCTFDELVHQGRIDVILLTHNHFDHLDVDILPRVPPSVQWIVPLGLTPLLVEHGIRASQITELDWWASTRQTFNIPVRRSRSRRSSTSTSTSTSPASPSPDADTTSTSRQLDVTAVPATHWSARTPLDTNRTLWNSYSVRVSPPPARPDAAEARLFFCGDTGYSPSLFTAIGRCLGPFDVAAVPIGSFEPRWHMAIQHMHAVESVQVVKDVGARRAFAMHWGTWQMSDERWDDPPRELARELEKRGEPQDTLRRVGFGETVDVPVGAVEAT
ncbi:uncharacterized protein PFL1_05388 [Pseudozyma flocculosa PF-1]|uniref:Related to FMP30 - mitochondrial inner membrane protein with a role in maintaining mitochondrial morphology n=2 Tax=Pseudozyma flocculosa TaxID=84751 RepID=A0A5C3FB24_9BASI|nr:uncharacterized protein PFL1_05388 [Pseudozyma flocculosa PF-1]EPQ27106.1 hypothetical protein PFL1_05388 [Pseudozyma flocculosa PF-1]SPO41326.1 related to FMP30 - mitochondrial inner membrane protein with a role in maintaining mitochondrial morphology [Pseudozyma flocculosa]